MAKATLQTLQQLKEGCKPLATCPICSKTFKKNSKMLRHRREVHLKLEPKFECKLCDKRFKRKEHFKRHMNGKHFSDKYTCSCCNKRFVERNRMLPHILQDHRIHDFEKNGLELLKSLTCSCCKICFLSKTQLDEHLDHKESVSELTADSVCNAHAMDIESVCDSQEIDQVYLEDTFPVLTSEQCLESTVQRQRKAVTSRKFENFLENGQINSELSSLWFGGSNFQLEDSDDDDKAFDLNISNEGNLNFRQSHEEEYVKNQDFRCFLEF